MKEIVKFLIPIRLILNIFDKENLTRNHKYVVLSNLSLKYRWKNIKKSYKNKFKILALKWNDKSEYPNKLYSISGIQYYFEYISIE